MAMSGLVLVFALLAGCAQADTKNRPVSKVITLLKDMVTQLQKESEEDQDVYEQMGCWCETNDREKTKAISDAEQRIQDLGATIEETAANSARLNTEVANLQKEVAKNEEALDQATALRKKQLAEFNEEEKDMLQSVSSLKGAVVALSKHHDSLVQDADDSMETIAVMMKSQFRKHRALLAEVISPMQRRAVDNLVEPALLQSGEAVAAPSGEIFGILKTMKETFETNLGASQREETENQRAFEDLKSAKKEEIDAGTSQVDTKTTELAATDTKHAQSKQDLEDTSNSLSADTAFLADLKERCANIDAEYEERTKTRQLEIQAVGKALSFLSSDEAHDLFSRTMNFVQLKADSRVKKIAALLEKTAARFSDPRLSALAVRMKMGAFEKVKKTIQDMVDALIQEKEDEIKHKDFCIDELNQNDRDTDSKNRDKDDIVAKIEGLTMEIDELTRAMESLKAEIAEMQVQMKRAGEDREKANKEFQMTVADQRATQKLLAAALGVLKGVYDKAALAQVRSQQPAGPPPPAGFKNYEKNASSGGVMGMIQNVINDAKAMEAEAIKGEEESQATYEDFVKNTNKSTEEKQLDLTNKGSTKAKAEGDLVEAKENQDSIMGEIEQLMSAAADLHKSCDYTIKNFDLRQQTRDDEIEALKQSIAIFSGASFSAFLSQQ